MPDGEDQPRRVRRPPPDPRSAMEQAECLRARTIRAAEETAATEDEVAATMDRLAEERPLRAEHLRAMGQSARRQAARQRQWLRDHSPGPGDQPGNDD